LVFLTVEGVVGVAGASVMVWWRRKITPRNELQERLITSSAGS
jgi:hypothetical protein